MTSPAHSTEQRTLWVKQLEHDGGKTWPNGNPRGGQVQHYSRAARRPHALRGKVDIGGRLYRVKSV